MSELGRILFLHLLALFVLQEEDDVGKKYADQTLDYPVFDGIRFSATDLCNLIATYKNSERYLDEKSPSLPLLQLKRFLRNVASGTEDKSDTRAVFYRLMQVLKINDATLNKLRRDLIDSDSKHGWLLAVRQLYYQLLRSTYNSDLIGIYITIWRRSINEA